MQSPAGSSYTQYNWGGFMAGARHALKAIALLGLGLLAACATGTRLSDPDRARLGKEAVIPVLVYESPLPRIQAASTSDAPVPAEVRRVAGSDPALLVAQGFTRLLEKKYKLKNLRVEARLQPRPVADSARSHLARYQSGLLLELWVEQWGVQATRGEPNVYKLTLNARARLTQMSDGRVLWSSGRCTVGAGNNNDWRVAAAELKQAARLRKILAAVRDECARQLLRDFDSLPDNNSAKRS